MIISKDKTYQTRSGLPVRIYATDAAGSYPIHGAVMGGGIWQLSAWRAGGLHDCGDGYRERDLVEVKPRHKRTIWLNVYHNYASSTYNTKEEAVACAVACFSIACLKIDLDFEEGEGL